MNAARYIQYKGKLLKSVILNSIFRYSNISNQESVQRFCNGGDFRDLPRLRRSRQRFFTVYNYFTTNSLININQRTFKLSIFLFYLKLVILKRLHYYRGYHRLQIRKLLCKPRVQALLYALQPEYGLSKEMESMEQRAKQYSYTIIQYSGMVGWCKKSAPKGYAFPSAMLG